MAARQTDLRARERLGSLRGIHCTIAREHKGLSTRQKSRALIEPGHRRTYFTQDLKGGARRRFGPEGVAYARPNPVVVSPDGKAVAILSSGDEIPIQPVDGSAGRTIPHLGTDLAPMRWCSDGRTPMLQKQTGPALLEVFDVDVAEGKQTLWRSITAPPGSLGVSGVRTVRIAPDCQSAIWAVSTSETRLFLVRGDRRLRQTNRIKARAAEQCSVDLFLPSVLRRCEAARRDRSQQGPGRGEQPD